MDRDDGMERIRDLPSRAIDCGIHNSRKLKTRQGLGTDKLLGLLGDDVVRAGNFAQIFCLSPALLEDR